MRLTLPLPRAVDEELAADVEKQAVYVSPHLVRLRVTPDRAAVEVEGDDRADAAELRDKVTRYVEAMTSRFRKLPRKVIFTNARRDRAPLGEGVYAELRRRGWVEELGHGQAALAGPALAAADALDAAWTRLGRGAFEAAPRRYPSLIPSAVLARCGYFTSFPHAVSMVTHLVEDYDLIEEFRRANAEGGALTVPRREALTTPSACLQPAVCYHCYQALEGRTLGPTGHVVTALGRCYRYESKNIVGLDRLWDFAMREIIFVGTEPFVSERRQRSIELVSQQVAEWDLDCAFETANDPFFAPMYASKSYFQVRGDLKFEMRLAIEPGEGGTPRTLAAGSFNLHEDFFGRTFRIGAADGKEAFTGCTAFGVERWVLALFTQHGLEPARWPESLRADVFA